MKHYQQAIFAVLLVALGFFAGLHNNIQSSDDEQPLWITYQNPQLHFSLEHPSSWSTIEEHSDWVGIAPSDGGMGGISVAVVDTSADSTDAWLSSQPQGSANQGGYQPIGVMGSDEIHLVAFFTIVDQDGTIPIYGKILQGLLVKNKQLFTISFPNQTPINVSPHFDLDILRILASLHVDDPIPTAEEIDAHNANTVLAQFLGLLSEGTYQGAVFGYGGDYDQLREWNHGVDPNDFAQLWKNGCEMNGLQCLKVENQSITSHPDADTFIFTVTFLNAEGSRFTSRGQSEFSFTVTRAANDLFQVQTMPVYVE